MKLPSYFALENFLLLEASLALYARFAHAATSNTSTCTGCTITAGPRTLTFPAPVSQVTQNVTATVIPFIFQYSNGTEFTSYSTFNQYTTSASGQSVFTAPTTTPLTWTTLGTTLTYPTTYIAFISPLAGISRQLTGANSFCYATLTGISLQPSEVTHLIFPSTVPADHDIITSAAANYIESLPSVSAQVSPYNPAACSVFVGPPRLVGSSSTQATLATSSSQEAVVHTTVALLVQTGRPVITRLSPDQTIPGGNGNTPGLASNVGGKTSSTPSVSAGGSGTGSGSGSVSGTPNVSLVLNVGGSTITPGPSGAFNVGGQTLTPGGTAVVISGTTLSLAPGGSVAVVNGESSTLASATATVIQATGAASRFLCSGMALCVVGLLGFMV